METYNTLNTLRMATERCVAQKLRFMPAILHAFSLDIRCKIIWIRVFGLHIRQSFAFAKSLILKDFFFFFCWKSNVMNTWNQSNSDRATVITIYIDRNAIWGGCEGVSLSLICLFSTFSLTLSLSVFSLSLSVCPSLFLSFSLLNLDLYFFSSLRIYWRGFYMYICSSFSRFFLVKNAFLFILREKKKTNNEIFLSIFELNWTELNSSISNRKSVLHLAFNWHLRRGDEMIPTNTNRWMPAKCSRHNCVKLRTKKMR